MSLVVTFRRTNDFIKLHNTEDFAACLHRTVFLNWRLILRLTTTVIFPMYLPVNFGAGCGLDCYPSEP